MSSSGPSKEDLQMYWNNSRQYFDELANYYKTEDPAYYNQYIAPFYSNPFNQTASSNRSSGSKMALLFAFVAFMIIAAAGVGVFFFVSKEQEKTDYKEKYIDQPEDKNQKEDTKSAEQDTFPDDEFLLGAKYLAEKDYDKAEEHLKKVNPGDRNYKEAQQLLKNIKYLRKYNK